jgi:hypothetical protein
MHQFCTPEWLEESARIYEATPGAKDKLKKLTATLCYRVKSDLNWGIREDIIFCSFFEKGELTTLNFFTADQAFRAAEYLIAATPQAWKMILIKQRDFIADFAMGKIDLELGTKVSMFDLAFYLDNVLDCLTQVDLQFPDEMSAEELTAYKSKMEAFRHAKRI